MITPFVAVVLATQLGALHRPDDRLGHKIPQDILDGEREVAASDDRMLVQGRELVADLVKYKAPQAQIDQAQRIVDRIEKRVAAARAERAKPRVALSPIQRARARAELAEFLANAPRPAALKAAQPEK